PMNSLEKDTDWLFSHTFPTVALRAILQEMQAKLEGKSAVGAFLLEGGLGAGKSHLLTCRKRKYPEGEMIWPSRRYSSKS
ncbi:MAG TPA: hypothetical protein VMX97_10680, partial [Hyphomicrobiaceae bacterium]|nr:hypothetical protein [Hyphomicrobiaceae bacterium]